MRVFYRADGNAEIGTGHLLRGILLARELQRAAGTELVFCSRDYPWARARLEGAGMTALWIAPGLPPEAELEAVRRAREACAPDLAVADVLDTPSSPDLMGVLGAGGLPVVTLDDTGPGRLSTRAIVNFLVRDPDPAAVASRGIALHEGPRFATLVPEYEGANEIPHPIARRARRLLVSLGGGDAAGLTLKVVRALARCRHAYEAVIAVGSTYPHREALDALAAEAPSHVEVRQNVPSLLDEFRGADMAVVAGGLTMHEALATGTPALALVQDVWHQEFLARLWSEAGLMVNLGRGHEAGEARIAAEIDALAEDAPRRAHVSREGQRHVDGRGAHRVARILLGAAGGR